MPAVLTPYRMTIIQSYGTMQLPGRPALPHRVHTGEGMETEVLGPAAPGNGAARRSTLNAVADHAGQVSGGRQRHRAAGDRVDHLLGNLLPVRAQRAHDLGHGDRHLPAGGGAVPRPGRGAARQRAHPRRAHRRHAVGAAPPPADGDHQLDRLLLRAVLLLAGRAVRLRRVPQRHARLGPAVHAAVDPGDADPDRLHAVRHRAACGQPAAAPAAPLAGVVVRVRRAARPAGRARRARPVPGADRGNAPRLGHARSCARRSSRSCSRSAAGAPAWRCSRCSADSR